MHYIIFSKDSAGNENMSAPCESIEKVLMVVQKLLKEYLKVIKIKRVDGEMEELINDDAVQIISRTFA